MAAKTDISQTSISAGQQLEFWRLASNPNSHVNAKTFQAFLEGRNPFPNYVTPDEVKLTLAITQSTIQQMIAEGKYAWVNEDIVEMFKFDPATIGTWEFRLVNKGHKPSEKAQTFCEEDGWQVGSLEHLLVLGATFPRLQEKNSIIALGSVCGIDGDRRGPALWYSDDARKLHLVSWCGEWHDHYRFLSVRKISDS